MTEHGRTPETNELDAAGGASIHLQAAQDGAAARRRGEPRDPTPYLPRYAGQPSLVPPEAAWLMAYDQMDALLTVEAGRAVRGDQDRTHSSVGDRNPSRGAG